MLKRNVPETSFAIDNVRVLKASVNFVQAQRSYLSRQNLVLAYLVN